MANQYIVTSEFQLTDFSMLEPGIPLTLREKRWMLMYSHGVQMPCVVKLFGQYAAKEGDSFVHLGGYQDKLVYSPYLGANLPLMSLQSWVIAYPMMGPNGPIGRAGAVTIEKGAYASSKTEWVIPYGKPSDYRIPLALQRNLEI